MEKSITLDQLLVLIMVWYKYIIAIIVISVSLCFAVSNTTNILYGDALGYYSYLPASVIHHKLDKVDELADDTNIPVEITSGISRFKYSYSNNDKGNSIIQYSYGLSAMLSPGFFTVYLWDKIRGKSSTGFELRYQNAIVFLNIFYLLLGLFFCYKSIHHFFPSINAFATVAIGLLGTNLLWFGFIQHGMAHIPQFMLISFVVYLSIRLSLEWSDFKVLLIAFLMGLITIIRPVDIIFGIVPIVFILESLNRKSDYKTQLLKRITIKLPFAILLFIIPIIPQLLYWNMMTGSYIYDSYSNYNFNWADPQITKGLFGAKNGWFMYTPVMLLAVIGFYYNRISKSIRISTLIILPIHIYITYSWYNYNYINGFGSRPMLHIYPLMLFGIAGIISTTQKKIVQWFIIILVVIASIISLNFTYKQWTGKLFSDESTWVYNKSTFYKKDINYHDLFYLNSPWNQAALSKYGNCISIKSITAEDLTDNSILYDSIYNIKYVSLDTESNYPTGAIVHTISDKEIRDYTLLKSSINMRFHKHQFMQHHQHKLIIEVTRKEEQVFWHCILINDKIAKKNLKSSDLEIRRTYINTWDTIDYNFPLDELQANDQVKVYLWNSALKQADFSSMQVSLCQ